MHYQYFVPLALAAVSQAADSCPDGSHNTLNGELVCCPGALTSDNGWEGCVVGCTTGNNPCFPFCEPDQPESYTHGVCTSVPFTASDYTQRVYGSATTTTATANPTVSGKPSSHFPSPTMSHNASVTPTVTLSPSPKPTNTATETGGSGDSSSSSSTDEPTSPTPSPTSTDEPGAAAPRITQGPILALAGGLVGLALL